jgi:hypothetical protein
MGPIALFDKSFLQSLSVDESVWFDHFFLPVICPLFYVETLADLEKAVRQGRSPEQEVGIIAQKIPEMSGNIVAYHMPLAVGNLLGYELPMDGRIPRAGGRQVEVDGKKGVVYEPSPEEEAFDRWQKGEFLEVERRFAKTWRSALNSLDLRVVAAGIKAFGIDPGACKALGIAHELASSFTKLTDFGPDRIRLTVMIIGGPRELESQIIQRFAQAGWPALAEAAPYAAHVVTVEIFFQIAVAANLISPERVSNRTDIAYLFYLPFCHAFISSDHLHRRCVPLFLRRDQSFVWGLDLKSDLRALNEHYSTLPESERQQGIMRFAHRPATSGITAELWDRHLLKPESRRDPPADQPPRDAAAEKELVAHINRFADAPEAPPQDASLDLEEIDSMCVQRRVHKRKGSWWQLPHDLKEKSG